MSSNLSLIVAFFIGFALGALAFALFRRGKLGGQGSAPLMREFRHSVRTPLSVILGFSELMMTHSVPDETRRTYTEKILKNAKRLQKLIDDLNDPAP